MAYIWGKRTWINALYVQLNSGNRFRLHTAANNEHHSCIKWCYIKSKYTETPTTTTKPFAIHRTWTLFPCICTATTTNNYDQRVAAEGKRVTEWKCKWESGIRSTTKTENSTKKAFVRRGFYYYCGEWVKVGGGVYACISLLHCCYHSLLLSLLKWKEPRRASSTSNH